MTEWRRVWKRERGSWKESWSDLASNPGWLFDIGACFRAHQCLSLIAWALVICSKRQGGKKPFLIVILCLLNNALFFGRVSYDNVQKRCILFQDRLIFQSKRCAVILASWCWTLTRWFVSLISPVGNLASEITPFLSLRSSSISCPNGGQSHSLSLGASLG